LEHPNRNRRTISNSMSEIEKNPTEKCNNLEQK
jgi:hypothetical protein